MCSLLVDRDRRFIEVSDKFCKLTGYSREELTGMSHDDLIAPGTAGVGKANDPFTPTGCSEGLWLLVTHGGTRILVHYESHLRNDYLLQIEVKVVGIGY
jgi:PAS domain S-box-containing protein